MSAYEATESECGDDPALWLKYGVGRARLCGQTGRIEEGMGWLGRTQDQVGSEACNGDPAFLHVSAGLSGEAGDPVTANTRVLAATERAEDLEDWRVFVMCKVRSSSFMVARGHVVEAVAAGRAASSASLAMGSERMASACDAQVANNLIFLGQIGEAYRVGTRCAARGTVHEDEALERMAEVALVRLSAFFGLQETMPTVEKWANLSSPIYRASAQFAMGIQMLLEFDWAGAYPRLKSALGVYEDMGARERALEYRFFLAEAAMGIGNLEEALDQARQAQEESRASQPGMFENSGRVLVSILDGDVDGVAEVAEEMSRAQHTMQLCYWAYHIVQFLGSNESSELARVKGIALGAFQELADSCEDAHMKKEVFERRRYRLGLEAIAG